MRVIDVHVHVGYEKLPENCSEVSRRSENSVFELSYEDIVIEKVIFVPSFPCGNNTCSDGFYQQVKNKGDNPIWASVNPLGCNNVIEELERQISYGVVGIKLHPVHHGYSPNAYREEEMGLKALEEIYSFAQERKLPVMIHTGTSVGERSRNKFGDPLLIDDVVKDFDITIILAHSGRPLWYNTAFYLGRNYSNVYLEISSIPPEKILTEMPRLMEIEDKVLYGSDFPNYRKQNLAIHAYRVYRSLRSEKIMLYNAKSLLKLN
ncbi:amidohydrolase [Sulfolobales archaeon HS-7]|nr:amidohydrolase [Sulfolobales archaeon HS-7]